MKRLEKLWNLLKHERMDGLLITSPVNIRYLTGFTGTSGVALITNNDAFFVTDFRYTEQASDQVIGFDIKEHKGPIQDEVAELVKSLSIESVGFEKEGMTYGLYEKYNKAVKANLIPSGGLIEKLRLIKDQDEISIIKDACKIADDAFDHILDYIKPGVKEIDISNELEFFMRKQGATSSSFDIIVASGYRSALPHGVASSKEIQSGELVTLDFGALYEGYASDITRTIAVGDISEELATIYNTVLEAQVKGVEGIKAGITAKQADALTRDHIDHKGYGKYFGHSTGHGLGLDVHEMPGLSFRSDAVLEPGMVVTVEPGIYVPNVGGCRIEDDIIITEDGHERLTHSPKDLIRLPVS
ncbi:Creatinase/Prolidase N-terminal domain-containing protein [Gracilibacillus orientalis]|uniref:Creatinase/Prolidase N-terminal domain-containing protein n=1 Tax=Gracilibacillus orientalis TaxID=334253 RepID=A0A1I4KV90_9BACI|nr:Xaa-Pro peptidase family protein [Gracilibacillus orientalis]SFL82724.1 Creatinase/Prolidase N-terminal domain-containing protein [Gracilibacillus orientalis]